VLIGFLRFGFMRTIKKLLERSMKRGLRSNAFIANKLMEQQFNATLEIVIEDSM